MDFQVVINDFFVRDLKEIVEYLAQQAGSDTASRIGQELVERAIEVGRAPVAGSPVQNQPGTRKVFLYSYVIYYEVNKPAAAVEILRIRHGSRNPRSLRLRP